MTTINMAARTAPALPPGGPGARKSSLRGQVGRFLAAVAVAIMVITTGFLTFASTNTPTAKAGGITCLFDAENAPASAAYASGLDGVLPRINANTGKLTWGGAKDEDKSEYAAGKVTVFDAYGTNGMMFTRYTKDQDKELLGDPCGDISNMMGTFTANMLFGLNRAVSGVAISLYQISTHPDLPKPLYEAAERIVNGGDGKGGLAKFLYWPFLQPIIMAGAIWMAYAGLIKKRSSESLQAVLWMVGSVAVASLIMTYPAKFLTGADYLVSGVTSASASSIASAAATGVENGNICKAEGKAAGVRSASCAIYATTLFTPWSVGQFGQPPTVALTLNEAATKGGDEKKLIRPSAFPFRETRDVRLVHLDAVAQSQSEWAKANGNSKDKIDWQKDDKESFEALGKAMKNKDAGMLHIEPSWRGNNGDTRVTMSFIALLIGIAIAALVGWMSLKILALVLEQTFLVGLSPFFLLIGIHPSVGRGVALRWAELLGNTVVKRIVFGLILSVFMAFYQVIGGM